MSQEAAQAEQQQTNDTQLEDFELQQIQELMTEFKKRIDLGAEHYKDPMQLIEHVMTLLINTNTQVLANFFVAIDLHKNENRTLKQNVILEYITQMNTVIFDMARKTHEEWPLNNGLPKTLTATTSLQ